LIGFKRNPNGVEQIMTGKYFVALLVKAQEGMSLTLSNVVEIVFLRRNLGGT